MQNKNINKIVVKVGSSTLTHKNGALNLRLIEKLVRTLSDLQNKGIKVALVTSGAVAVGASKLGLKPRPCDTPTKQALAAVGQCELMYLYDKLFSEYNHNVAQVLLTKDVIENDTLKQSVINTFNTLLSLGVIPIINENDTVCAEEIIFGDNDTLSAIVAVLINADALVLLSDIDGLYDKNPKTNSDAKLIAVVKKITPQIIALAEGTSSNVGTGGMITKIHAAQISTQNGIDMHIICGDSPQLLYDIIDKKPSGTVFIAKRREC